jgi:DNA-binding SARP family transcriptional activator
LVGDGDSVAFGDLLKGARAAAALSQRELAARAGMSTGTVRDLEQGRSRYPHPASLRRLVAALDITGSDAEGLRRAAMRPAVRAQTLGNVGGLRVLGALCLGGDDGSLSLRMRADRQRTVLARLALTPNEVVPRAELCELLWGSAQPPSAIGLLQTYIARLRPVLRPLDLAHGGRRGYVLRASTEMLDLLRFRELTGQARLVEPGRAAALLFEALQLWRGDPVADVAVLAGHPVVLALTDERIVAALQHATLTEALGRHEQSLAVLRELAARNPLHEPLWGRYIVALAATGLQAQALAAFDAIRERLAEELGIDPGPELAASRQRVLRQDLPRTVPPRALWWHGRARRSRTIRESDRGSDLLDGMQSRR